jgi:PEP-CTERM motif
VPEPVSLLLIGTSLIGLGVSLRRKRAVSAQSAA